MLNQIKPRQGLPWRRGGITLLLFCVLLVAALSVRADIVVPSVPNEIFFQTTGPLGDLGIGDYVANRDGDARTHLAEVGVPCVPNVVYRLDLFDPEVFYTNGQTVDDEVRSTSINEDQTNANADQTNFRLYTPNGMLLNAAGQVVDASDPSSLTTYQPSLATHDTWVEFRTIRVSANPVYGVDCGVYRVETWTGSGTANTNGQLLLNTFTTENFNNDENAWRYRIRGGDLPVGETFPAQYGPDGRPGTGDEAWLGLQRMSYQNNTVAAQSFYWFVDNGTPANPSRWVGRNFDVDINTFCFGNCNILYNSPDGTVYNATLSDTREWNTSTPGGGRGVGDVFDGALAVPGLWSSSVTISPDNQYIFEVENQGKPTFMEPPELPAVVLDKTVNSATSASPGILTYTLRIENRGVGAALPLPGNAPEATDTLPPGMRFSACRVLPPLTGSCSGAGTQVFIQLEGQTNPISTNGQPSTPIAAFLPGTTSGYQNFGFIEVDVLVDAGIADGTCLLNNAAVDWTDVFSNDYRPVQDNVDICIDHQTSNPPPPPPPSRSTPTGSGGSNGGGSNSAGNVLDCVLCTTADGLSIVKRVDRPFATAGTTVTWQFDVSNNTQQPVRDVRVVDAIPPDVTLVTATTSSAASSLSWTDREVQLDIPLLAAGERVSVAVQTVINPNLRAPFTITNSACIVVPANLCAAANILSVTQLPATGEGSGWHGVAAAALLGIGLMMGVVTAARRGWIMQRR